MITLTNKFREQQKNLTKNRVAIWGLWGGTCICDRGCASVCGPMCTEKNIYHLLFRQNIKEHENNRL